MERRFRKYWIQGLLLGLLVIPACQSKHEIAYVELLDEDPEIRADAAMRIGQARASKGVDSLIAVLDDPAEAVRVSAIRALGEIGEPRAVPALLKLADDPLITVRAALCQALTRIADPTSVPTLGKLLYDVEDSVRLTALYALARIPGDESLELIVSLAIRDQSDEIREHVIKVIGNRGARRAIPNLESALRGEADDVRANAAIVLGDLGDRSSVPALIVALDDPYFKVRSLSAHSLSKMAPDHAGAMLAIKARIEKEDHMMSQVDLTWSLARMGDRTKMDLLRRLLFHGQPEDVRAEAAWALGEVGDESDIPRLERALDDKKGLVKKQVIIALERLRKA